MKNKTLGDIEQNEQNSRILKFLVEVQMPKKFDINEFLDSVDTRIKVNLE